MSAGQGYGDADTLRRNRSGTTYRDGSARGLKKKSQKFQKRITKEKRKKQSSERLSLLELEKEKRTDKTADGAISFQ